ncbi:MAG: type II toxin-antitoxin system RelE/ParE family toxin [Clostridiales bacterium]|jgi:mRNA interferase RelE/StbE|nr:type II toxin-antitoxin system RelE/ParE family toxin [Clostridiales bacterium]
MNPTIYSKQAAKVLNGLDRPTQQRIRQGVDKIPNGDIKQIKGRTITTYRLRIGNWRILFSYTDNNAVAVEKIAPRGEVYKGV